MHVHCCKQPTIPFMQAMNTHLLLSPPTTVIDRRPNDLFPKKLSSQSSCVNRKGRRSCSVGHRGANGAHNINPTCSIKPEADEDRRNKMDRRNVLIGLGGAGLGLGLDTNPLASGAPIPPPDFSTCGKTTDEVTGLDCCPPTSEVKTPTPFKPVAPPKSSVRTRLAAQNAVKDPDYIKKYRRATELMKGLDVDDPRNFWNQANVHCSYCDGAFNQNLAGYKCLEIQVHNSWLFFPFHRWFLFFYERILGSLIDDPTFALPFWNWDSPDGMYLPELFELENGASPLYDHYRNTKHRQKDFLLDLNYSGTDVHQDAKTLIDNNLKTMNRQMNTKDQCLFFGQPYRAGDCPNPGGGNIELIPHNTVHNWTGDPKWLAEDMGKFYSSARDPIFFAHHSNVDRMWHLWLEKIGGKNLEQDDWLNAEFYFYNEKKELVSVTVQDSIDIGILGYAYENVDIPWLQTKPTARKPANKAKPDGLGLQDQSSAAKGGFSLDSKISIAVPRPKQGVEKAEREEILILRDIKFPSDQGLKFDVYVNDDADTPSQPSQSEFAGSFVHVPHKHGMTFKTSLYLGIKTLLKDVGADKAASVVVTLVPRYRNGPVTIGGISIEQSSCD
ncbi:polyphenol oxidase, chloroplastic-like [Pyrus communis]|uniref:polyphenol oxidase, chloroplastic-like n=1 Tax=Pyrus communis TaxID=23211 RepID=UPI0035BF5402